MISSRQKLIKAHTLQLIKQLIIKNEEIDIDCIKDKIFQDSVNAVKWAVFLNYSKCLIVLFYSRSEEMLNNSKYGEQFFDYNSQEAITRERIHCKCSVRYRQYTFFDEIHTTQRTIKKRGSVAMVASVSNKFDNKISLDLVSFARNSCFISIIHFQIIEPFTTALTSLKEIWPNISTKK